MSGVGSVKNKIRTRFNIIDWKENMTQKKYLLLTFILLFTNSCEQESAKTPANYVQAIEAQKYIGDVKTICGKVVDSRFASSIVGHPTYLNIDRPYPNPVFTIVIWGNDRNNFDPNPEGYYLYKPICVTGLIQSPEGVAQIEINNPKQIWITQK